MFHEQRIKGWPVLSYLFARNVRTKTFAVFVIARSQAASLLGSNEVTFVVAKTFVLFRSARAASERKRLYSAGRTTGGKNLPSRGSVKSTCSYLNRTVKMLSIMRRKSEVTTGAEGKKKQKKKKKIRRKKEIRMFRIGEFLCRLMSDQVPCNTTCRSSRPRLNSNFAYSRV